MYDAQYDKQVFNTINLICLTIIIIIGSIDEAPHLVTLC